MMLRRRERQGFRTAAVHAGESDSKLTAPETPNALGVSAKAATLEQTELAVVTPSGASAIATSVLTHLASGDHLLAQERINGETRKLFDQLELRYGIRVSYVSADEPRAWAEALQKRTRIIYFETLSNPLLEVAPLDAAVAFAREHGLLSVIDNTFGTPINFQPAAFGFDLVVHSASEYLSGHPDVVAGVVAGKEEVISRVSATLRVLGSCLPSRVCGLLERDLKTLPLRVPVQNESAYALAHWLEGHPSVERVFYPGLVSNPSHARASQWFRGYGAALSFVPRGGLERSEHILARMRRARVALSFGGVDTQACRPTATSHSGLAVPLLERLGIPDSLIRLSVGIEDTGDLIADLEQALAE